MYSVVTVTGPGWKCATYGPGAAAAVAGDPSSGYCGAKILNQMTQNPVWQARRGFVAGPASGRMLDLARLAQVRARQSQLHSAQQAPSPGDEPAR